MGLGYIIPFYLIEADGFSVGGNKEFQIIVDGIHRISLEVQRIQMHGIAAILSLIHIPGIQQIGVIAALTIGS